MAEGDKPSAAAPPEEEATPMDPDLFVVEDLGRLEAIYGGREDGPAAATTSLKGPIGYIVQ